MIRNFLARIAGLSDNLYSSTRYSDKIWWLFLCKVPLQYVPGFFTQALANCVTWKRTVKALCTKRTRKFCRDDSRNIELERLDRILSSVAGNILKGGRTFRRQTFVPCYFCPGTLVPNIFCPWTFRSRNFRAQIFFLNITFLVMLEKVWFICIKSIRSSI